MEVSLHRTRSLLGEKVIHLRHLEQSLDRVANAKKNENDATVVKNDEQTLSDMSSASSGFSSTDLGTDTFMGQFTFLFIFMLYENNIFTLRNQKSKESFHSF